MLQRSPTYVVSLPAEDPIANWLRRHLPDRAVYSIVRWKNVTLQGISYRLSRRYPELMKKLLRRGVERMLPPGYDVDTHFNPSYNPWDQRLCLVPDADLFGALGDGSAEVVTDRIAGFDAGRDRARVGRPDRRRRRHHRDRPQRPLPRRDEGDDRRRAAGRSRTPGLQRDDAERLPQLRLRARLHQRLLDAEGGPRLRIRLPAAEPHGRGRLRRLRARGDRPGSITEEPLLDFNSGYVLRALDGLPKQGSKEPWKLRQSYPYDLRTMRRGSLLDGSMQFRRAGAPATASRPERDAALT